MKATVFAPGSVGNVGPGFDVLGLAVGGAGDTVTVELSDDRSVITHGCDAELIPTDPAKNAASIAAEAMLTRLWSAGVPPAPIGRLARSHSAITIKKGLPMSGGIESLNAAAAATVLFYEAARQRNTLPI